MTLFIESNLNYRTHFFPYYYNNNYYNYNYNFLPHLYMGLTNFILPCSVTNFSAGSTLSSHLARRHRRSQRNLISAFTFPDMPYTSSITHTFSLLKGDSSSSCAKNSRTCREGERGRKVRLWLCGDGWGEKGGIGRKGRDRID